MLLGGDLKFLFSVVVVVVGWLVARWKWRRAATRREEISRLMAFASEEAARAELEAAASYKNYAPEPVAVELAGPLPGGRQFQYHCEVCFSPTTTRCKQCKAVRYCSRKCQILHWRQGHKDECHSLTTSENIDVGVHSYVKEPEQDGTRQNAVKIEVLHTIKPDESTPETCTFSNSNFYELGENADIETEVSDNSKITDLNVKTPVHSLPDECSSSPISIQMPVTFDRHNGHRTFMDAKSRMPHTTEKPSLTSHGFCLAASSASNELQFGRNVAGEKSESSKSGFSPTGSEDYSLSKSSSPSSGFWAGTVEHMRSKINALDEVDDVDMSKSCSSSPPSSLVNSPVEMLGSGMNKVMEDNSYPAATMPKKSIALLEVNEYGLDSREPLSLSSKLPGLCGDGNTSSCCRSMGETKLSSSDACHGGTSERHVPSTSVVDVSCLQSLAPKKLNNETDRTNGILDTSKFQQNDSSRLLKTESHLCSSANTRNPAIQVLQSVETERTHDNASRSLDSSSYLQSATTGTKAMTRIVDQLRVSNVIRHDSLGAGSGTMGRYEGSFPYELFVKLYNWNKIELSPCGLINCGNSCYANAVLQCLAFTPPLAAYCLQGLHAKICKKKEWCFTCGFEELVEKAKESNNPLSPARILSQMQRMGSHLGNGKEEDAHEFLRYAIDAMQSVCLKEAEANVPSYLIEATTLLGLTFGGYLQSKIECMRCGGKSKQHERIMDLSVEIGGEIGSLEDALLQFTHSEILDGENKYHCGRCKSYEKAKKKLRVLEAPNVLVVALKRFQTGKFGKLNKAVKFPEILNLAPYMSGTSDKSPIYQLYGVLVHLDVMNAVFSGHYVCYIKNNQGRWFKADDSVVQAVGLEKVLSSDAYILFYARCSPRAPRVIRSLVGPRDPRKSKNLSSKAKSHPWDVPVGPTTSGYFDSFHTRRSNAEEESSSEYSSSYFSSEAGSHSTESSNRESVSTTDLDHCSSDAESSSCSSVNMSPKINGDGFRAKDEAFARGTSLCRSNKEGSRVGGYSSRETRKQ